MPEPFRLFVPPPIATEKLVLAQSGPLALALPVVKVRQVLLEAAVTPYRNGAATSYDGVEVPVLLGNHPCPPASNMPLVLFQVPAFKTGLVAIACTQLPRLAMVAPQEWVEAPLLPPPWVSEARGYASHETLYTLVTDLAVEHR